MIRMFLLFLVITIASSSAAQQTDSIPNKDSSALILRGTVVDSPVIKKDTVRRFIPRKAAIRSAIIPGWGQVYNKKYWKVPIVYVAIGIPVYTFFDNRKWYRQTRDAARMVADLDTLDYRNRVDPKLYIFFTNPRASQGALLNYRNEFRRDMDYSILFTLLFWGLNVVDATVDAHLKGFDISEDLSLKIKPKFDRGPGVGLVFNFKNKKYN